MRRTAPLDLVLSGPAFYGYQVEGELLAAPVRGNFGASGAVVIPIALARAGVGDIRVRRGHGRCVRSLSLEVED